jgi:hypothetical protein
MEKEVISKLIAYYKMDFFTEPALLLVFVFSFVIGLLYNYGQKERILFLIYFFIGTLLFLLASPLEIVLIVAGRKVDVFNEVNNTAFELAEFIAFQYFFKRCYKNERLKKISNLSVVVFGIIVVAFFTALTFPAYSKETLRQHSFLINVIEFFFLSFFCLAYFYELFTVAPKLNLFERPSFFITTSVFFYSVLLIPFFIIARSLMREQKPIFFALFSCHYVLLIIVLISVSKAFLCKKPITT